MIEPVSKDKCLPEILALFPDLIAHRHDIRQLPAFFYSLPRGSLKTATVA